MNYYAFVSLFNGIVVLCVGFYLLSRQRQNHLYQSFSGFSVCVGLWCIFYALWQVQTAKAEALMYMRLAMMAVYPVPFAFLWFVMDLVGWKKPSWYFFAVIGTPLCFMLLGLSPFMVKDVSPKLHFPFWPDPGVLMHVYLALFCMLVLASYWILWQSYRKSSGVQQWQIKWISLTLLPAWIGGASNWCLWYNIPVPPIPHFFVGVGFLILTYPIVRSRLFDIDTITDLVQEAKLSALGIMATSINHEVRNPLFVIKGLAETLLEKSDAEPSKIKDIAQRTVMQAERALEIIRNFSAYAKRQSSKDFDKQSLDVKEILESIVPLVCSELALDHIRLRLLVSPKTIVCADRHSLEEIFINLIVNACQAMPGGGEIEISAKEEKPWLSIKIRDTGPGLPSEQLSRIFEPFYTTKAFGTGLGLYVVKQLVEKNGGRIQAISKEGFETVFVITLPL